MPRSYSMQRWNTSYDPKDPNSHPTSGYRGEGYETMHVRALLDEHREKRPPGSVTRMGKTPLLDHSRQYVQRDGVLLRLQSMLGSVGGIMSWTFATEEISAKLGQTLGGLMNATFGNAVELIVRLCAYCN